MVEVYVIHNLAGDAAILAEQGRVQVNATTIYSYQGQDRPFPSPEDWGHFRDAPLPRLNGAYNAHPGDVLICVGTSDRYGYAARLGLVYHEVETVEEARAILAGLQ